MNKCISLEVFDVAGLGANLVSVGALHEKASYWIGHLHLLLCATTPTHFRYRRKRRGSISFTWLSAKRWNPRAQLTQLKVHVCGIAGWVAAAGINYHRVTFDKKIEAGGCEVCSISKKNDIYIQ